MAVYVDSTSGVTEYAKNTAYVLGDRVVPAKADTGTNHGVAKKYVWECTTAGTTDVTNYPSWDASYTPDSSTETSGTATFTCRNPGYSSGSTVDWTFATIYFEYAVNYAATADGTIIYVAHDHSESLTADTTYTFAANIRAICVNSGTGALASTAVIGAQATNYTVTLAGAKVCYFYGIEIRVGTGSTAKYIQIGTTGDGVHYDFESCKLNLSGSGACLLFIGSNSGGNASYIGTLNCTMNFSASGQRWRQQVAGLHEHINLTLTGTAPTTLIVSDGGCPGALVRFSGCDLSLITGTLVGAAGSNANWSIHFSNCKLGSGVTPKAASTTIVNRSTEEVMLFNCNAGDNHYSFYHADAFGSTEVVNTTYANDGATYDGTNRCSWKIITTANCNYYNPYVSPWMEAYKIAADGLTLSLEGLRGSDTDADADVVAQNDEIWGQFSTQDTTGFTKGTIVNADRMLPLGSEADQTSAKATTDWTIDVANDAYKSTFKLESGSVNQKEIGHIRARVCVGIASKTFFVDPQIRGLT